MLVIDLIELVAIDRPEEVWELDRADPVRLENNGDPFEERVNVWNLGENIVTDNEVCPRPGFGQRTCCLNTKEFHESWHSPLLSGTGYVLGWIDTKDWNALFDKELQQISIIATKFNDPTGWPEV